MHYRVLVVRIKLTALEPASIS